MDHCHVEVEVCIRFVVVDSVYNWIVANLKLSQFAILKGQVEVVKFLVTKGANRSAHAYRSAWRDYQSIPHVR
jgi:hypothetical protein